MAPNKNGKYSKRDYRTFKFQELDTDNKDNLYICNDIVFNFTKEVFDAMIKNKNFSDLESSIRKLHRPGSFEIDEEKNLGKISDTDEIFSQIFGRDSKLYKNLDQLRNGIITETAYNKELEGAETVDKMKQKLGEMFQLYSISYSRTSIILRNIIDVNEKVEDAKSIGGTTLSNYDDIEAKNYETCKLLTDEINNGAVENVNKFIMKYNGIYFDISDMTFIADILANNELKYSKMGLQQSGSGGKLYAEILKID